MNQTEIALIQDAARLARLRATGLLDAPTDEAFDRLTRLAVKLLDAPISTVTLLDTDRQFYMSCVGIPEPLATERQTPLEYSFCKHTVILGKPLVIPDVRDHPVVGANPAIAEFGVTAYAGIPLLTADGHALGTLCVMDFRVRHWTDEQIASLADLAAAVSTEIELRMDIAERARVEKELQQTLRQRDEVLGIVSHDLRNPVHAVSLISEVLLESLAAEPEVSPDGLQHHLELIHRSARQMDRLIRDLLDVASIVAGHLSVETHYLGAASLLDAAAETLRPIVEKKGIRFRREVPDEAPVVAADPDRILQLFSNLVGNAVKFTAEGGEIALTLCADEEVVRFGVADTGVGIAAEHLPHLFEQFWQGDAGGRHGAGLGLAIAHGIVTAHGGTLTVRSEQGRGTTFTFTLPVVDGQAVGAESAEQHAPAGT